MKKSYFCKKVDKNYALNATDTYELIRKIKAGDRKAFNLFCMQEYSALETYAMMFLSDEWASDVVQDVLFSTWQRREFLDENSSVHNYMLKSVYNRCLNYLKKQTLADTHREWNDRQINLMLHSVSDIDSNATLRNLFDGDLRRSLNDAIKSLPAKCREVFCLSYIEDMSNKDIADKLGISVRTVESHMYTALKHLRSLLSKEILIFLAIALMKHGEIFIS